MVNIELMVLGAPVPVAPWACPGTPRAGEVTVEIFRARPGLKAILLRNHGLVAIGKSLENAFEMAYDAEVGFQTYYQARLISQPLVLNDTQIMEIKTRYKMN
jgi:ribulose-5-phosphate 4-epimerase/fuculose-1-phosphate aldolase